MSEARKKLLEKQPDKFKELHPHTMRHTFVTRALEQGMQIKTLQKILGHSTLAMTMDKYGHVLEETLEKEMNKMLDIPLVVSNKKSDIWKYL